MENFDKYYNQLKNNEQQKEAVDTLEGPLLVLAGPGTGKTQILSIRAANIIMQKKALPENILILTYTNTAVKTMKERLTRIIGFKGYDVYVATFHSFANSIILDSEEAANYIRERILITDIEQRRALEYILDHERDISEIRPFNAPYNYVPQIQSKISELKREGVSPQEFQAYVKALEPDNVYIEEKHIPRIRALAIVYDQYEKLKTGKNRDIFDERGRYDYDDMIMMATEALNNEPLLRKKYKDQYSYLMVDEFQDTNGAQLKLLFSILKDDQPNICCVGDDDQSIYRFQGASVGNFKELKSRFKKLHIVSLRNNYRSSEDIIGLSQHIINEMPVEERTGQKELIPVRKFKNKSIEYREFSSEEEELIFLAEKVKEFKAQIEKSTDLSAEEKKYPYNNIAVLVRKRESILKIIDKFLQAGIPYATDGKEDIRSEKRVRQMIDVLELASINPDNYKDRDTVLYRVLTSDYFKIPHSDILGLIAKVNRDKKSSLDATILSELLHNNDISKPLRKAGDVISELLRNAPYKSCHTTLMEYIERARIYRYILEEYDKHEIARIRELRGLASFVNMVKSSDLSRPGITLREFVDELRARNVHNLSVKGELVTMTQNGVRVFTAHGSKGQEFYSVIIPFFLQDKNWPLKQIADIIPIPPDLLKCIEKTTDKEKIRTLQYYDELRLFYVAVSRSKSNVIFTASPQESDIKSSFLHHMAIQPAGKEQDEEPLLIKSLNKSKDKDPFIGTEEVLRDLVSDISLNPTSLNNYFTCRRKFLYDNVLMLASAKKQSLIFGNAVHSALEHLYRSYINTGVFQDFQFFKEKFMDALKFQGPEKNMELRCIEHFEGLRKYFHKISSHPVKPLGLENRMPVNIDGIIFTGKYDKLELEDEENKTVRVVDYKTGKPNDHAKGIFEAKSLGSEECDDYLRQLVSYKLLFERDNIRLFKEYSVSHGVLVFVEPAKTDIKKYGIKKGEPTELKIPLNEDMVDEMTSMIKDTWKGIQTLHFEKLDERDNKKCSNCDFDSICWNT